MSETFLRIDELLKTPAGKKKLAEYSNPENQSPLMARDTDDIGMYVGCTACVALVTKDEIYVANAGDARCVLARNGHAIEMSTDHKPELPTEKSRIEKAGGFVEENRVKGILNLSRSLGDLEYKSEKSLGPELQMITAFPELKVEKIT